MSAAEKLLPPLTSPLGRIVDVNILGTKAKLCSFDCAYCDLGATEVRLNKLKDEGVLPSVDDVIEAARADFKRIHTVGPMIDTITISGNGEATLHPEFPEIVKALVELRNEWLPGKPIALFTNGALLEQRRICDAANLLDQRFVKLDAGNERVFKTMNTPLSRVTLQKVLGGIRRLKDVSIQAMFAQGAIDNTQSSDIEDWIEVIALLQPKTVWIQGVSRAPQYSAVKHCDEDTLYTIASKLERRTALKAIVLP